MEGGCHGTEVRCSQLVLIVTILCSFPLYTATGPSCPDIVAGLQVAPAQDKYVYPDNVTVSCDNSSLALIGGPLVHCSAEGRWTPALPVCQELASRCPMPLAPSHGHIRLENSNGSQTAHFSCDIGHVLAGHRELVCTEAGNWSQEHPTCYVTGNCSNPQPPDHGFTLAFNCTHHNCMALFSCEEGYWLDGSNTTVCTDSGNWTRNGSCELKTCRLVSIMNGTVSGTPGVAGYPHGTTLEVTCDQGFLLQGSPTLQCDDHGQWSEPRPSCIQDFSNTTTSSSQTLNPAVALDTTTAAPRTTTPKMVGLCPPLTPVKHGRQQKSGRHVKFFCDHGYKLDGQDKLLCLNNGSWTGAPPTCNMNRQRLTTTARPKNPGLWQQVFVDNVKWVGVYKFENERFNFHFNVNSVPIDNGGVLGLFFEDHGSKLELKGFKDGDDILFKIRKIHHQSSRFRSTDWYMRGRLHRGLCSWKYEGSINAIGFGSFTMESYIDDMLDDPRCSPNRQMTLVIVGICVAIAIVVAIAAVTYYCIRRKGGIRSSGHRTLTSFENPVYEYENSLK